MAIAGVDVSSHNGAVDWAAVAASGIVFGADKATEGTTYTNPTFAANWTGMQAAGVARIAYHFARPDANTAEAEAAYFLSVVQPVLAAGDITCLDLETGSGDLAAWALTWLQTVEAATGAKPWLYSGRWFMDPHNLINNTQLAQYGLWLAAYQATLPPPAPGWDFVACWQYSASARLPGISVATDTDQFQGTLAQLRLYGVPAPPPPQLPPLDAAARLQACGYLAGGSGVKDMITFLTQYADPVSAN